MQLLCIIGTAKVIFMWYKQNLGSPVKQIFPHSLQQKKKQIIPLLQWNIISSSYKLAEGLIQSDHSLLVNSLSKPIKDFAI